MVLIPFKLALLRKAAWGYLSSAMQPPASSVLFSAKHVCAGLGTWIISECMCVFDVGLLHLLGHLFRLDGAAQEGALAHICRQVEPHACAWSTSFA